MIQSRMTEYMEPAEAAQKREPLFIPPPVYMLAAAAAAMVLLNRIGPEPRIVPRPLRRLGVLGILAGFGLSAWGATLFHRSKTSVLPTEQPKALVTEGPFRFTRNPMYLGMAVVLAGFGVLLRSLLPLLVIPVFLGLLTSRVIRAEEQSMARTFGDAYEQYKASVPRWFKWR
jgi:protein-S-isoprenylcysteine O-methyltransferase Ste14